MLFGLQKGVLFKPHTTWSLPDAICLPLDRQNEWILPKKKVISEKPKHAKDMQKQCIFYGSAKTRFHKFEDGYKPDRILQTKFKVQN